MGSTQAPTLSRPSMKQSKCSPVCVNDLQATHQWNLQTAEILSIASKDDPSGFPTCSILFSLAGSARALLVALHLLGSRAAVAICQPLLT